MRFARRRFEKSEERERVSYPKDRTDGTSLTGTDGVKSFRALSRPQLGEKSSHGRSTAGAGEGHNKLTGVGQLTVRDSVSLAFFGYEGAAEEHCRVVQGARSPRFICVHGPSDSSQMESEFRKRESCRAGVKRAPPHNGVVCVYRLLENNTTGSAKLQNLVLLVERY